MSTSASFEEIYRDVPAARREDLLRFRAGHPYRRRMIDGVEWQYIAAGQGDRAVLVLGGGMSVGETGFQRILDLERRYRVLSPSYPLIRRVPALCDGLAALLEAEGVATACVFGHSLGSAVGHAFVRRHPARVDRLVLDAFGLYTPSRRRFLRYFMPVFIRLPYPWFSGYYRKVLIRLTAAAEEEERLFWRAYAQELFAGLLPKENALNQFRLMLDFSNHGEDYGLLRPVEMPGRVLIIRALNDRGFTREEQQALIDSYPGAQVHTFEQGGHLSGATHAAEFDRLLYGFIE